MLVDDTKTQKNVIARIAKLEWSVLCFGVFFRAVRVGSVKRLSFSRLTEECRDQCVLMKVPDAKVKELFDFSILRLIDRTDVDPTLAFVAVARLCMVDWYACSSLDWFLHKY